MFVVSYSCSVYELAKTYRLDEGGGGGGGMGVLPS